MCYRLVISSAPQGAVGAGLGGEAEAHEVRRRAGRHRWNGNPRPQPEKFRELMSLISFSESYIFLNWLSGALVGGRGFGFRSLGRADDDARAAAGPLPPGGPPLLRGGGGRV